MQLAEGFGNYLYIIFAVVYVIYSMIKAGKKANANKPTIQPSSKPSNHPTAEKPRQKTKDLKDILEDLLDINPPQSVPAPVEVKSIPKKKPKVVTPFLTSEMERTANNKKWKAEATTSAKDFKSKKINPIQELTTEEETSDFEFDAKTAIIYSEILKRPQY